MADKNSETRSPGDAGDLADEVKHPPGGPSTHSGADAGAPESDEPAEPSPHPQEALTGPSSAAEAAEGNAAEAGEEEASSPEGLEDPGGPDTVPGGTAPPPSDQELREILAELDEELGLEEPAEEELVRLREELDSTRDRHLRLAADFDNYRKRADQQRRESWIRAQAEFLARLLDALDDLQRVGDYDPATSTVAALHEGVALVERKIFKAIADMGAEVVDPAGEIFDPAVMEAMATIPAESKEDDDKVREVFQKGYIFKGQLVRPARVIVQQYE